MIKSGKNLDDIQDMNRSLVLRHFIQHEGCSRVEVAEAIGLTQASITKIIRILIEKNVVLETSFTEGKKGRRSIGISLNYSRYNVVAVKISWNQIKICVYNFRNDPQSEIITVPIQQLNAENINNIMSILGEMIMGLCQKYPNIIGIGVAVPGPYQRDMGNIFIIDRHNSFDGRYYPFKENLRSLVTLPVFTEYDASAGALGYWWCKSNFDNSKVFLHILASEGVGVGVVDNGRIFAIKSGHSSEMGHITIDINGRKCTCGSTGCLEAYCSFPAIQKEAGDKLADFPDSKLRAGAAITSNAFFEAVRGNDALALGILREASRYMGYGILSLIPIFDPDVILISDILAEGGDVLLDEVNKVLDKELPVFSRKPQLILIDHSEDPVLLGASTVAIDGILSSPKQYLGLE